MSATPSITMHPVTSSQIAAIGHCPELNVLAIQFPPKKSTGISDTYHYQRIKKFPELYPYAKVEVAAADPAAEKFAADHALALDINARCYGKSLSGGQYYSRTVFKDNGDPILLYADGKRSVFCDLNDDMDGAA